MNPMKVIWAGMAWLWVSAGGVSVWAAQGPPTTRSFTNATPIEIIDDAPASVYPSIINVSGMTGVITRVTVTIRGLNHSFPDDIDILLAGPAGKNVMLMSDAGGSFPLDGVNVTFADGFPSIPNSSQIVSATYAPTNWGLTADAFPSPGPAGPYLTGLTNFSGLDPNGAWRLFVFDDVLENVGSIDDGWVLTVSSAEDLPELAIMLQGANVELSWPTNSVGYVLEGRAELIPESSPWSSLTNSVVVENGRYRVTLPLLSDSRFFRLRK
jgi:subtilisin-like proprotein convertase family protein